MSPSPGNETRLSFSAIDVDVLLQIFDLLDVRDILSIRQCSKYFDSVSRLRTVWHNALIGHVLEQDIPLPRSLGPLIHQGSLDAFLDLSAEALETVVLFTLRSFANWTQPIPRCTLASHAKSKLGRVFYLKFLHLRSPSSPEDTEGRHILTAGYCKDNVLCMQIWDLDSGDGESQMHPVGEWTEKGRLFGLAIEEDLDFPDVDVHQERVVDEGALIALSVRSSVGLDYENTLRILHFSLLPTKNTSSDGLQVVKSIRVATPVRVESLNGRRLAIRIGVDHNIGVLKVIDWVASPSVIRTSEEAHSPILELAASQYGLDRTVLEVHFIHDWALVFREPVVEFYLLPSWLLSAGASNTSSRGSSLQPTCLHKWAWNINSLSVVQRVSWSRDLKAANCEICLGQGIVSLEVDQRSRPLVCACRYRPLSIAIRFDSYFPWPVNLMHHYVLPTQTCYDPILLVKHLLQEDAFDHNPPAIPEHDLLPGCNSPFMLPPRLEHTIPSSVRLFARSDLVMCRYGTLVWLDSEAGYPSLNSVPHYLVDSGGQNLAYQPSSSTENNSEDPEHGPSEHYDSGAYADGTGERIAGRHLDISGWPSAATNDTRHLESSVSRALESTIGQSYGGSRTITTLFSSRQWEGWYSIAANERAGRVVAGGREGGIEVWDYS